MAQEDHRVFDCCVWLSFPASVSSGWKIKTTLSRTKHLINSSVRWVQNEAVDVLEKSGQVHVALMALTESESFDIKHHQVLRR